MLWNNIGSKVDESKTNIDYFINQRSSGCMELLLQDLVSLSQANDPLHMDPLGSNDPIPDHSLCWQLVDPSHCGRCINLHIVGGEQILNLKEVIDILGVLATTVMTLGSSASRKFESRNIVLTMIPLSAMMESPASNFPSSRSSDLSIIWRSLVEPPYAGETWVTRPFGLMPTIILAVFAFL